MHRATEVPRKNNLDGPALYRVALGREARPDERIEFRNPGEHAGRSPRAIRSDDG